MSWLDRLFDQGYDLIQVGGVPLPTQRIVDFVGSVTGANDVANKRTILTVGTAFGGGGNAVSGALGSLSPNSFYTISLATQDSTATLPAMTADGFVSISFTCGTQTSPKKATIFAASIDASISPQDGLVTQCQFSNTGTALFFWNQSLGYWIQQ